MTIWENDRGVEAVRSASFNLESIKGSLTHVLGDFRQIICGQRFDRGPGSLIDQSDDLVDTGLRFHVYRSEMNLW